MKSRTRPFHESPGASTGASSANTNNKTKTKTMTKRWKQDEFAESRMRRFGLKWNITEVAMHEIKLRMTNVARPGDKDLDSEKVNQYAIGMRGGDVFPMPVLRKLQEGGYAKCSGHHRIDAANEVGLKTVQAYVYESDDEYVNEALPTCLNQGNGKPLERKIVIEHVLGLHLRFGKPLADICKEHCISDQVVHNAKRALEARERLKKHQIHSGLPDSHVTALNVLQSDQAYVRAAMFTDQRKLNQDDTRQLVKEMKAAGTEAQQIAVIGDWEKKMPLDLGQTLKKSRRSATMTSFEPRELRSIVARCEKLFFSKKNPKTLGQFQITDKNEQQTLIQRIAKIETRLSEIRRAWASSKRA